MNDLQSLVGIAPLTLAGAAAAHAQRAVNYLHDLQPGATQVAEAA